VRKFKLFFRVNFLYLFFASFFFCKCIFADVLVDVEQVKKSCIVITLPSDLDEIDSQIKGAMPEPFVVKSVTYNSDIKFEDKEFSYLIGFTQGDTVDFNDIQLAVSRLIKKNKIEKINLAIHPDLDGKHIHFGITGFWTFKKLKIHGILVGKNEYGKLYAMEHGDPFHAEQHNHSLKKIGEVLKNQGYFDSKLTDDITRDKETKSVSIDLVLDRGTKFSIKHVTFYTRNAKDNGFDGLSRLERKMNDLFVKKLSKRPYSKSLINKVTRSVKRYLAKKGFLHVDIELIEKINYNEKHVDLNFVFMLHSKKEFIFFGNSFFSNSELLDKILLFGRSAWLVPATILSGEIERAYHEKGFWNCSVETRQGPEGCFFLIKESSRVSIKNIVLKGVERFDSEFLVKKCFSDVLRVKYFDEEKLQKSLNNIVSYYLQRGFWDITLLKKEYKKLDKQNCYKLIVSLQEGQQFYVKSIAIEGFEELLLQGPFAKCVKLKETIPFDARFLTEQRNWLVDYFKNKGYLHVDVKYKLDKDGQEVSLTWIVIPGMLIKFGKTIVMGSGTFPIDNIMRELQYKEGDVWDNENLKESVLRLRALEIFDHVHLYPYNVSVEQECKDVLLKLHNEDSYEIRTRVGLARYGIDKEYFFGKGFTYRLGGSFLWKNLSNIADKFVVDFDVTRSYSNAFVSYCRPWIFGLPVKTIYKLYVNRYEQPGFICSKKNLYEVKQDGFLVGFNRVYRKMDFSCNIGVEWMETSIKREMGRLVNIVALAINFDSCLLNKKIPYIFLEPTILIDRVDDKLFPMSGYLTLISAKGMFPLKKYYSNSYFIRLMAEQSFYYSLTKSLICAARFRFGYVFNQRFKNISPIERFYLGGAHSIRSYEKDMCPPWGIICDKERNFQVDTKTYKSGNCLLVAPQGGKTMFSVNLEGRFNLYKSLWGVIFQDVGTLVCEKFNQSNVSAATGFGLRYNTILGPIRFDFALKWRKRRTFESRCAWFLAFGNAF